MYFFFPTINNYFELFFVFICFYTHTNTWMFEYKKCSEFCQGVSVEAVDPVFQAKMLDMLKQTGR